MNRNPWLRGRSTSRAQRVVLSMTATLFLASCSQVSAMRGNIDGLTKVAEQAERNGAIRCAPRELALAKSHLEFATVEIDQGFWTRAKEHLDIAEANAHAAYDLSPPQKCAERASSHRHKGDHRLSPRRAEPAAVHGFQAWLYDFTWIRL